MERSYILEVQKESHINILEEAALLRQASWVARDGRSKRVVTS